MRIKLNPYRKKDGTMMLYANNDRKVSLGVTDVVPAKYSKRYPMSNGQINLMNALGAFIENAQGTPVRADGMYTVNHAEDWFSTWLGMVYLTDVATVCGQSVGSDGAFLWADGKLINLSQWVGVEA